MILEKMFVLYCCTQKLRDFMKIKNEKKWKDF